MKTICKVFAVLAVLTGILTLVAAAFAQEQKPEYIRIYGEPAEENESARRPARSCRALHRKKRVRLPIGPHPF